MLNACKQTPSHRISKPEFSQQTRTKRKKHKEKKSQNNKRKILEPRNSQSKFMEIDGCF